MPCVTPGSPSSAVDSVDMVLARCPTQNENACRSCAAPSTAAAPIHSAPGRMFASVTPCVLPHGGQTPILPPFSANVLSRSATGGKLFATSVSAAPVCRGSRRRP